MGTVLITFISSLDLIENDAQYPPIFKSPYIDEDCNVFLFYMSSSAYEVGNQKRLMTKASLFPTNSFPASAH